MILLLTFLFTGLMYAQKSQKIKPKDFEILSGSWKGSLTYLDYSSGKPYTMPADLEVLRIDKTPLFVFSNIYPKEPDANSKDTIKVNQKMQLINNEIIKSGRRLENGGLEIITEESGTDGNDNKPATFKFTYMISANKFTRKKEVKFNDSDQWIMRHQFSYSR